MTRGTRLVVACLATLAATAAMIAGGIAWSAGANSALPTPTSSIAQTVNP